MHASGGLLVEVAASDSDLVAALRLFGELQEQRHPANYDHDALFGKVTLLIACEDAERARSLLGTASAASRDALFTLLTLRRSDMKER